MSITALTKTGKPGTHPVTRREVLKAGALATAAQIFGFGAGADRAKAGELAAYLPSPEQLKMLKRAEQEDHLITPEQRQKLEKIDWKKESGASLGRLFNNLYGIKHGFKSKSGIQVPASASADDLKALVDIVLNHPRKDLALKILEALGRAYVDPDMPGDLKYRFLLEQKDVDGSKTTAFKEALSLLGIAKPLPSSVTVEDFARNHINRYSQNLINALDQRGSGADREDLEIVKNDLLKYGLFFPAANGAVASVK